MKTISLNRPESTVIVETANNGFIVTRFSTNDENEVFALPSVIESEHDDWIEPDFDAVQHLLWQILEDLEIYNSKHFRKRIEIEVMNQGKEVV
jgi:hypothetical protein